MISQIPDGASQRRDLSSALPGPAVADAAAAAISTAGRTDPGMEDTADPNWQIWNPRHRELCLHPVVLIVLVNLGVVALGLTASYGLVSLSAEQPPPITMPEPGATTALPAAPSVQAPVIPTFKETPPSPVPDLKLVVQSPAPPSRLAPPSSSPKVAERNGYVLQLGAFADPAGARRMQANVRKRGYPAVIVSSSDGGKALRLVRIDGFRGRNDAVRTADDLRNRAGLSSIIMKAHNP